MVVVYWENTFLGSWQLAAGNWYLPDFVNPPLAIKGYIYNIDIQQTGL